MDEVSEARLKTYVTNSNDALEFKLIRDIEELNDERTTFKPEMSHQVFGDSETIFGYRNLKVKLYYSAGCLETYLGIDYTEKLNKHVYQNIEVDDVLPKIAEKLAPNVHDNIDSFIKSLDKDNTFRPSGELIHSFMINDKGRPRHFEVYRANMTHKGFKEYHQRLQTFLLWYIDAANFIDIDDDQWDYFNMYEKYHSPTGSVRYATIGFVTVYHYYAYPDLIRPRIAQILILPPFQNMGLGAHLLRAIYQPFIGSNEVKDITVEDPSVPFQRLRDYVDALNCRTLPSFSRPCLMRGFSKQMVTEAREKYKINKKQVRRVYEILRLQATDTSKEDEYREYRLDVKRRLNIPFKKEQNDWKKLESALKNSENRANVPIPQAEQRMQALEHEYRLLEEEYKKVVMRLDEESEM